MGKSGGTTTTDSYTLNPSFGRLLFYVSSYLGVGHNIVGGCGRVTLM